MSVRAEGGCPREPWFREQLAHLSVRGEVSVTLGPDPTTHEYAGEIDARTPEGAAVHRRITGPSCTTVAESLVVVAQVHLTGKPAPTAPPPDPAPRPRPSAPRAPLSTQPVSKPPVHLAAGLSALTDTAVSGTPMFGAAAVTWLSFGDYPLRGFALSGAYSRADLPLAVPVTVEHLRARLDAVPFDLRLTSTTSVGIGAFVSVGNLHVSADIERSTPGGRVFWLTGLGLRARQDLPARIFLQLDADATLALTRRRYEVTGVRGDLFSLPLFGAAFTLSAGIPLFP
ncbi:MAG: hypothetical protein R3F14_31820 [Polyangiaceae bacterium]